MDFDVASVDEVLATTRAVRRRLDLERPVDNELLLDCIDLAEQAPTGGNLGSRRWIIVRDQAVKDQLGELYRTTALPFMSRAAERLRGTGHPQERVMASAAFLAEHLAEVPAIVIPTIIGRHDGNGRPGLFDSVIQAAWSFCLALRARGPRHDVGHGGAAGRGAGQGDPRHPAAPDRDRAAAGGVDEGHRLPARAAPPGPGDHVVRPLRHDVAIRTRRRSCASTTGLALFAEVDIAAPPAAVWPLVTDMNVPAAFSEEFLGAEWQDDARGVGAVFIGRNHHPAIGEWTIPCFVEVCDEPRSFGWCTSDPDDPGARWRFDLEPLGGQTRLRFTYQLGPGPSGTTAAIDGQPGQGGAGPAPPARRGAAPTCSARSRASSSSPRLAR